MGEQALRTRDRERHRREGRIEGRRARNGERFGRREGVVDQGERVAVGLGARGGKGADAAGAAADVLHDDGLPELRPERRLDHAGEQIDAATRRPGHDDLHRPVGIDLLRACDEGSCEGGTGEAGDQGTSLEHDFSVRRRVAAGRLVRWIVSGSACVVRQRRQDRRDEEGSIMTPKLATPCFRVNETGLSI